MENKVDYCEFWSVISNYDYHIFVVDFLTPEESRRLSTSRLHTKILVDNRKNEHV